MSELDLNVCKDLRKEVLAPHGSVAIHKKIAGGQKLHRVKCEKCGKMLHPRSLRYHKQSCNCLKTWKIPCKECGKMVHPGSLEFHIRSWCGLKPWKIPCEECGKMLNPRYIKYHQFNIHGQNAYDASSLDSKRISSSTGIIGFHKGKHHSQKQQHASHRVTSITSPKTVLRQKPKKALCKYCVKMIPAGSIGYHKRTLCGRKPCKVTCEDCGKMLDVRSIKNHKLTHLKRGEVPCTDCGNMVHPIGPKKHKEEKQICRNCQFVLETNIETKGHVAGIEMNRCVVKVHGYENSLQIRDYEEEKVRKLSWKHKLCIANDQHAKSEIKNKYQNKETDLQENMSSLELLKHCNKLPTIVHEKSCHEQCEDVMYVDTIIVEKRRDRNTADRDPKIISHQPSLTKKRKVINHEEINLECEGEYVIEKKWVQQAEDFNPKCEVMYVMEENNNLEKYGRPEGVNHEHGAADYVTDGYSDVLDTILKGAELSDLKEWLMAPDTLCQTKRVELSDLKEWLMAPDTICQTKGVELIDLEKWPMATDTICQAKGVELSDIKEWLMAPDTLCQTKDETVKCKIEELINHLDIMGKYSYVPQNVSAEPLTLFLDDGHTDLLHLFMEDICN